WYYLSVGSSNSSSGYKGTFTLCVNDQAPYDYQLGAELIDAKDNWCSGANTYTNINATGVYSTSCDGSNYNDVWFKFQADTEFFSAKVTPGSLRYASITLYDASDNVVMCKVGSGSTGPAEIINES
ncbi:hypothetical protein, partial [Fulvivirga lutimaris]|uniref:hypothetical protein n=1 Tax=Fulvivirga lutimaris TaxID=1819566 RepID=UPI0016246452